MLKAFLPAHLWWALWWALDANKCLTHILWILPKRLVKSLSHLQKPFLNSTSQQSENFNFEIFSLVPTMTGPIIDKRCEIMSSTSDVARVAPLGGQKRCDQGKKGKRVWPRWGEPKRCGAWRATMEVDRSRASIASHRGQCWSSIQYEGKEKGQGAEPLENFYDHTL